MKISFAKFTSGLYLATPADASPEGTLRRGRGLHALSNGSARSRAGSTLLHALDAHSISYFSDTWHMGVGGSLYRGDTEIYTGLSGDRLSLVRMPPVAGLVDYLHICGGGTAIKVSSTGTVTSWGILASTTTPAGTAVAGGSLTAGTYIYQITYYNSTTGHRSNGNGTDISVTTTAGNATARLTGIPASSDSQVTHVEIWRSEVEGALLFYLGRIVNGTATYNDDGSVTLSDTELPTDNLAPYGWFTKCAYHNAAAFWITDSHAGDRGRLFYSPTGRCESVKGYLNVTNDSDPLVGIFSWQGKLGVASQSRFFEIIGTDPYEARELSGVPGISSGNTASLTPFGLCYEAADGVRVFGGTNAPLLGYDAIQRLFRGEAVEQLTAFIAGIVSAYARGEYFVSDGSQTIACNLERETRSWRDVGVGCDALYYEPEVDILAATVNGQVVSLEAEGTTTDAGTAIPFAIEPSHYRADREQSINLSRLFIDINTGGQALAVSMLANGTEIALGNTGSSASRAITEFILDRVVDRVSARVSGSLTAAVELFEIFVRAEPLTLFVNLRTENDFPRQQILVPGRLVSGGLSMTFDFDRATPMLSTRQTLIAERLYADIDTRNSSVTGSLSFVERSFDCGVLRNTSRSTIELPLNHYGRLIDLTLAGDFINSVRLYRLELDAYLTKGD